MPLQPSISYPLAELHNGFRCSVMLNVLLEPQYLLIFSIMALAGLRLLGGYC